MTYFAYPNSLAGGVTRLFAWNETNTSQFGSIVEYGTGTGGPYTIGTSTFLGQTVLQLSATDLHAGHGFYFPISGLTLPRRYCVYFRIVQHTATSGFNWAYMLFAGSNGSGVQGLFHCRNPGGNQDQIKNVSNNVQAAQFNLGNLGDPATAAFYTDGGFQHALEVWRQNGANPAAWLMSSAGYPPGQGVAAAVAGGTTSASATFGGPATWNGVDCTATGPGLFNSAGAAIAGPSTVQISSLHIFTFPGLQH
jgi:hypothetical protein